MNNDNLKPFRIDWVIKKYGKVNNEGEGSTFNVIMEPDPRRYEQIQYEGEIAYRDRNSGTIYPFSIIKQVWEKSEGLPVYYSPPKEKDTNKYVCKRKKEIKHRWSKLNHPILSTCKIEDPIKKYIDRDILAITIFVDLTNSTGIGLNLDPKNYAKLMQIFLFEMQKVIENQRGYPHRTIGDGILGVFIADSNYTGACDRAIQASMLMITVVNDVINPFFTKKKLPEISCHIGIDFGIVGIYQVGDPVYGNDISIIGNSVNITRKMQEHAKENQIILGKSLYDLLHCSWQQYACEFEIGEKWNYPDPYNEGIYKLYSIDYYGVDGSLRNASNSN